MKKYIGTLSLHLCLVFVFAVHTVCSQTCYPTSIVDASQSITTTISYDDHHNITAVTSQSRTGNTSYSVATEMIPTGYKRIFTLNKSDSAAGPFTMSKGITTNDKEDHLLMAEMIIGLSMKGTEKYIYNANHQLIQIDQVSSFTDPSGKVSTDHGRTEYTYPNTLSKNPSEIKEYGIVNNNPTLALIQHILLTYDNNKAMRDDFPFSAGPLKAHSLNNVLTADITYVSSNTHVKQSYSYTFNEKGYPLTKTYTFSGDETTDTYTYDCQ